MTIAHRYIDLTNPTLNTMNLDIYIESAFEECGYELVDSTKRSTNAKVFLENIPIANMNSVVHSIQNIYTSENKGSIVMILEEGKNIIKYNSKKEAVGNCNGRLIFLNMTPEDIAEIDNDIIEHYSHILRYEKQIDI
ncbi:hypothetical protein GQ473_01095 [archaeon]|nr:hypothetical protein [archaeon]